MKNLSKFIVAAFMLSVFFMGCKKDDDTPKNHMTYNDTEYDLSQGVLENYGQVSRSSVYNFDLVLLSSGFVIHDSNGEFDSLSGSGHGIVFELFTSSFDDLAVGDYVYDAQSESAGTFDYANGVLDYDMETETGTEFEINGGKLTVVQNGNEYEVNFDCTTTVNGKKITGFYKGSLKYYDYHDDLKSSKNVSKDSHFK